MLVRTADHGDLLGAHGGLHQKWFNLYDEATRVPFTIARIGKQANQTRTVTAPTSHVDLVPTLLGAAGSTSTPLPRRCADRSARSTRCRAQPDARGRRSPADEDRPVYLLTRDNMLEGDSGASGLGRMLGRPPVPCTAAHPNPAHTAANFEGLVVAIDGHLWKLVRSFDDPSTWTEPRVRHLAANGLGGDVYRTSPLDDQWELYDLTDDPIEVDNRWTDPALHELRQRLRMLLKEVRTASVPERNKPWPYASRRSGHHQADLRPPAIEPCRSRSGLRSVRRYRSSGSCVQAPDRRSPGRTPGGPSDCPPPNRCPSAGWSPRRRPRRCTFRAAVRTFRCTPRRTFRSPGRRAGQHRVLGGLPGGFDELRILQAVGAGEDTSEASLAELVQEQRSLCVVGRVHHRVGRLVHDLGDDGGEVLVPWLDRDGAPVFDQRAQSRGNHLRLTCTGIGAVVHDAYFLHAQRVLQELPSDGPCTPSLESRGRRSSTPFRKSDIGGRRCYRHQPGLIENRTRRLRLSRPRRADQPMIIGLLMISGRLASLSGDRPRCRRSPI